MTPTGPNAPVAAHGGEIGGTRPAGVAARFAWGSRKTAIDEFSQVKAEIETIVIPTSRSCVTPLGHAHSDELGSPAPQLQAEPMASAYAARAGGLSSTIIAVSYSISGK